MLADSMRAASCHCSAAVVAMAAAVAVAQAQDWSSPEDWVHNPSLPFDVFLDLLPDTTAGHVPIVVETKDDLIAALAFAKEAALGHTFVGSGRIALIDDAYQAYFEPEDGVGEVWFNHWVGSFDTSRVNDMQSLFNPKAPFRERSRVMRGGCGNYEGNRDWLGADPDVVVSLPQNAEECTEAAEKVGWASGVAQPVNSRLRRGVADGGAPVGCFYDGDTDSVYFISDTGSDSGGAGPSFDDWGVVAEMSAFLPICNYACSSGPCQHADYIDWSSYVIDFNANINSWDTDAVTSMESMFENALGFNGNLASWNLASVTSMKHMFKDTGSFTGLAAGFKDWDTRSVNDMEGMFQGSWSSDYSGIEAWNTAEVTRMANMFSSTDTSQSRVTMDGLFPGTCRTSTQRRPVTHSQCEHEVLHIVDTRFRSQFPTPVGFLKRTSPVDVQIIASEADYYTAFGAAAVPGPSPCFWTVSDNDPAGPDDYNFYFFEAWDHDTSDSEHAKGAICYDYDDSAGVDFDLHRWDVRKVTTFESMFSHAHTRADLSKWVLSPGVSFENMFANAVAMTPRVGIASWRSTDDDVLFLADAPGFALTEGEQAAGSHPSAFFGFLESPAPYVDCYWLEIILQWGSVALGKEDADTANFRPLEFTSLTDDVPKFFEWLKTMKPDPRAGEVAPLRPCSLAPWVFADKAGISKAVAWEQRNELWLYHGTANYFIPPDVADNRVHPQFWDVSSVKDMSNLFSANRMLRDGSTHEDYHHPYVLSDPHNMGGGFNFLDPQFCTNEGALEHISDALGCEVAAVKLGVVGNARVLEIHSGDEPHGCYVVETTSTTAKSQLGLQDLGIAGLYQVYFNTATAVLNPDDVTQRDVDTIAHLCRVTADKMQSQWDFALNPYAQLFVDEMPHDVHVQNPPMPSAFSDLSGWDTTQVTSMRRMFEEAPWLPVMDAWNTGNVEDMSFMFQSARLTDHFGLGLTPNSDDPPDYHLLTGWDTANVKTFRAMFRGARGAMSAGESNDFVCPPSHPLGVRTSYACRMHHGNSGVDMYAHTYEFDSAAAPHERLRGCFMDEGTERVTFHSWGVGENVTAGVGLEVPLTRREGDPSHVVCERPAIINPWQISVASATDVSSMFEDASGIIRAPAELAPVDDVSQACMATCPPSTMTECDAARREFGDRVDTFEGTLFAACAAGCSNETKSGVYQALECTPWTAPRLLDATGMFRGSGVDLGPLFHSAPLIAALRGTFSGAVATHDAVTLAKESNNRMEPAGWGDWGQDDSEPTTATAYLAVGRTTLDSSPHFAARRRNRQRRTDETDPCADSDGPDCEGTEVHCVVGQETPHVRSSWEIECTGEDGGSYVEHEGECAIEDGGSKSTISVHKDSHCFVSIFATLLVDGCADECSGGGWSTCDDVFAYSECAASCSETIKATCYTMQNKDLPPIEWSGFGKKIRTAGVEHFSVYEVHTSEGVPARGVDVWGSHHTEQFVLADTDKTRRFSHATTTPYAAHTDVPTPLETKVYPPASKSGITWELTCDSPAAEPVLRGVDGFPTDRDAWFRNQPREVLAYGFVRESELEGHQIEAWYEENSHEAYFSTPTLQLDSECTVWLRHGGSTVLGRQVEEPLLAARNRKDAGDDGGSDGIIFSAPEFEADEFVLTRDVVWRGFDAILRFEARSASMAHGAQFEVTSGLEGMMHNTLERPCALAEKRSILIALENDDDDTLGNEPSGGNTWHTNAAFDADVPRHVSSCDPPMDHVVHEQTLCPHPIVSAAECEAAIDQTLGGAIRPPLKETDEANVISGCSLMSTWDDMTPRPHYKPLDGSEFFPGTGTDTYFAAVCGDPNVRLQADTPCLSDTLNLDDCIAMVDQYYEARPWTSPMMVTEITESWSDAPSPCHFKAQLNHDDALGLHVVWEPFYAYPDTLISFASSEGLDSARAPKYISVCQTMGVTVALTDMDPSRFFDLVDVPVTGSGNPLGTGLAVVLLNPMSACSEIPGLQAVRSAETCEGYASAMGYSFSQSSPSYGQVPSPVVDAHGCVLLQGTGQLIMHFHDDPGLSDYYPDGEGMSVCVGNEFYADYAGFDWELDTPHEVSTDGDSILNAVVLEENTCGAGSTLPAYSAANEAECQSFASLHGYELMPTGSTDGDEIGQGHGCWLVGQGEEMDEFHVPSLHFHDDPAAQPMNAINGLIHPVCFKTNLLTADPFALVAFDVPVMTNDITGITTSVQVGGVPAACNEQAYSWEYTEATDEDQCSFFAEALKHDYSPTVPGQTFAWPGCVLYATDGGALAVHFVVEPEPDAASSTLYYPVCVTPALFDADPFALVAFGVDIPVMFNDITGTTYSASVGIEQGRCDTQTGSSEYTETTDQDQCSFFAAALNYAYSPTVPGQTFAWPGCVVYAMDGVALAAHFVVDPEPDAASSTLSYPVCFKTDPSTPSIDPFDWICKGCVYRVFSTDQYTMSNDGAFRRVTHVSSGACGDTMDADSGMPYTSVYDGDACRGYALAMGLDFTETTVDVGDATNWMTGSHGCVLTVNPDGAVSGHMNNAPHLPAHVSTITTRPVCFLPSTPSNTDVVPVEDGACTDHGLWPITTTDACARATSFIELNKQALDVETVEPMYSMDTNGGPGCEVMSFSLPGDTVYVEVVFHEPTNLGIDERAVSSQDAKQLMCHAETTSEPQPGTTTTTTDLANLVPVSFMTLPLDTHQNPGRDDTHVLITSGTCTDNGLALVADHAACTEAVTALTESLGTVPVVSTGTVLQHWTNLWFDAMGPSEKGCVLYEDQNGFVRAHYEEPDPSTESSVTQRSVHPVCNNPKHTPWKVGPEPLVAIAWVSGTLVSVAILAYAFVL